MRPEGDQFLSPESRKSKAKLLGQHTDAGIVGERCGGATVNIHKSQPPGPRLVHFLCEAAWEPQDKPGSLGSCVTILLPSSSSAVLHPLLFSGTGSDSWGLCHGDDHTVSSCR